MASPLTENIYVASLKPLVILGVSLVVAIPPFLAHVLLHPFTYLDPTRSLFAHLRALRSKFFYYAWRVISPGIDANDAELKRPLLARAHGVVLEIGAGIGANIKYYNRHNVHRLILVEPNVDMHPQLLEEANKAGFFASDDSLLLLGSGAAEIDEQSLRFAGIQEDSVDSVICVHVLCGIPEPAAAIEMYRRFLHAGGLFVFFEHVRSYDAQVAMVQAWYSKWMWSSLSDGCCIDRPTGAWLLRGPSAASDQALVKDAEITGLKVDQVYPANERWKEFALNRPPGTSQYEVVPHIYGYALKA